MVCSDIKEKHIHTEHHDLSSRSSCGVKLHSKNGSRLHSWLRTHPRRKNLIDMMLLRCKPEGQAAFSHHTPFFPQYQVRPMSLCLVHNPPASIGYRGFVFAVGPITPLGLVGDSGRTVRSLSAASKPRIYPTHGAEHSIHLGRRRGTYFQGA